MLRNLTVETSVRIESPILMSIAFFWLEIVIYEILLTLRESLLALSQLSTPTSFLFRVAWSLLSFTVGCKNCCIISKWTKTHLIWGYIHVIDIQKKEYWAQHRSCGTPNVMFDIEEMQFLIETYCFLLLKCTTQTSAAWHLWCLLINMSWFAVSNGFEKSR